jgi:predicted unusual protein kinase regulating ubiquinone biosynthesis (AarF/ABC1/UbiB family)
MGRYSSLFTVYSLYILIFVSAFGYQSAKNDVFMYHRRRTSLQAIPVQDIASIASKLRQRLIALPSAQTKLSSLEEPSQVDDIVKSSSNIVDDIMKPTITEQLKRIENLVNQHNIFSSFSSSIKLPDRLVEGYHGLSVDAINLVSLLTQWHDWNGLSYNYAMFIEVGLVFLVYSAAFQTVYDPSEYDRPYGEEGRYNASIAESYFKKRSAMVVGRGLDIALKSTPVILKYALDFLIRKKLSFQAESQRAEEVVNLLTTLGPTFIKVGQSLSIRTDLLQPAYIKALTQLQDKVPSFPTTIAKNIIAEEFGQSADNLFLSGLEDDAKVVAAASLGQVFKATLRSDGSTVAVKVQRPNIIMNVALDMYILRQIVPILKAIFKWDSNVLGIVDDWGVGFVNELDYYREANNAKSFMSSISNTPLKDVVFAPDVVSAYSSKRVLTTRWIDGDRIERSSPEEVTILCNIAMNTYLSMLLETPILHCDPHPGNLRRTPDGRLCIMDWGLVTSIDPEIQSTLIAHVSHLVAKDYAKVPSDLVKLGFVPQGKEDVVLNAGVVEVLADIYGNWARGGGASKIDINAVVNQVSGLTARYGNLFQLPPYFAYIARAFSVLEGIGLSSDPDYSIINECLPYISKRLLTDPNAKTEDALKTFIYGVHKDEEKKLVDTERLKLLVNGFSKYSDATDGLEGATTAVGSLASTVNQVPSSATSPAVATVAVNMETPRNKPQLSNEQIIEEIERAVDQIFDLLFPSSSSPTSSNSTANPMSTPIQRIVVEELGKVIGASTRMTWSRLRNQSGRLPSGRSLLGTLFDPIGLFSGSNLIEADDYDQQIVNTTTELINVLQSNLPIASFQELFQQLNPNQIQYLAQRLLSKIWSNRNEIQNVSISLVSHLLRQTAYRVENKDRSATATTTAMDRRRKRAMTSILATATSANDESTSDAVPMNREPSERVLLARELAAAARRESL